MNYAAIGDIHGRYDLLVDLLEKLKEYPDHKLVFLGDMVDRGPDSFKVVQKIKELTETNGAIALFGNHEAMMMDFYRGRVPDKNHVWLYNGGKKTITSYGENTKEYGIGRFWAAIERSNHIQWLRSLPLYYETEEVWFSHAPIPKDKYRSVTHDPVKGEIIRDFHFDEEALTWSWHGHFRVSEGDFARAHGKAAVCGHVHAIREGIFVPRVYDNIIYADTGSGCWEQAPLSAVIINNGKYSGFVQAKP